MIAELVNLDAEREALAGLLFHGREAWLQMRPYLPSAGVFSPELQGAFRTLARLAESGEPATAASIREAALYLSESYVADHADALLDRLCSNIGTLDGALAHARIVGDLATRRQLIATGEALAKRASDRSVPVRDLVASSVADLTARGLPSYAGDVSDGIWDALNDLERDADLEGRLPGVGSGIPDLDNLTDGWCPQRLVVLGARPACGKTAFAVWCANEAAACDHEVYFATLEQPVKEMRKRQIALHTGIGLRALRTRAAWEQHAAVISAAAARMRAMPLTFDAAPLTAGDVSLAVKRHAALHGKPVKVVFVDYLGWLRPEARHDRNDLALGEITKTLARLAKEVGCCVVLLAQLNRDSVKDAKRRQPVTTDLRDSDIIEHDADQIVLMWEPPDDAGVPRPRGLRRTVIELVVAKNRHGPAGSATTGWDRACNRYTAASTLRAAA